MCVCATGCAFYSFVPCALHRGDQDECITASFTDAIYFSMVTLTTVGYGDMGPSTPGTRLFTCVFGVAGVGLAALSLGVFIDEIQKYRARSKSEQHDVNFSYHFTGRHSELGTPACSDPFDEHANARVELNAKQSEAEAAARRTSRCERFSYWFTMGGTAAALFGMALWTAAGAAFYCMDQSWLRDEGQDCALVDAFYFAVITSTTIGYGDESPSSPAGRLLAVIYLPITTIFFCNLVGELRRPLHFYISMALAHCVAFSWSVDTGR